MSTTVDPHGVPCSAPEHRQFDFWLGDWEVRDPKGDVMGTNRVVRLLGGCVIQESWRGTSGVMGTSYNAYDAARGAWHQTWMDSQGTVLLLHGGIEDGAMVLSGTMPVDGNPAREVHHRISWSKVGDDPDRVRQHWEASTDGGDTWKTAFDGRYVRVP